MKVLFFLLLPCLILAQKTTPKSDPYFVALYTVGESWDTEKSPGEQLYFKEHSGFLSRMRKEGTIITGARYGDTGMLVLRAPDLKTVDNLLNTDVAIQNKLFKLEIHPYAPFYKGCLD